MDSKKITSLETRGALKKVVLVGTYKGNQLADWRGWYNYPIADDDKITEDDARRINELWLFKDTKEQKTYSAEFIGFKTRGELVANYAYPAKGKAHGERYLLFKTSYKYRHKAAAPEDAERVVVRAADFAKRSPKIAKQLKAYLESSDRRDPDLAKRLPEIIVKLQPGQLRVCESTYEYDLLSLVMPELTMPYAKPRSNSYRIVSLFAGCGGLDLGFVGGFDFLGGGTQDVVVG